MILSYPREVLDSIVIQKHQLVKNM